MALDKLSLWNQISANIQQFISTSLEKKRFK